MILELEELQRLAHRLGEIDGRKFMSHLTSLEIKIEGLVKSRENWKSKYLELKGGNKQNG